MDDQVKRQLHVGVGMDVSDTAGGLEKIVTTLNEFNKGSKDLAVGMAEIEKKVQSVAEKQGLFSTKTEAANKSAVAFAKNIKNEYDTGVTSAVSALKRLEGGYKKLQEQYSAKKSKNEDTSQIVAQMQQIVTTKNRIKQQEKKIQDEVEKHLVESEKKITEITKAENQKQIANEKYKASLFKQMADEVYQNEKTNLRELTAQYKKSNQDRISSSKAVENAFASNTNNLQGQLFNTAVQVSGVRALTNEVQNLGRAIIDINYNTINNQRLMGDFSISLRDDLNNSAAEIAKNTGILITDAQEIQGAWIRINEQYAKSPELLAKMSDVTAKFMSVGEIENAEDAVKLLNSSLLQFNLTGADVAKNTEIIANKMAYLADVTAMGTADEYAESISQIGANIKNMNGDIDDAIALTSIVGDKLAKNGKEAGAAIKTFTAYMQRDMTLDLMDELAAKWGDQSVKIREGTKGLKDFEGTIKAIGTAYGRLKAEGDQQGVLSLVNALGATRRRDAAFAMLDAISSEDGQNLDYYYGLIDQVVQKGDYLEQQNEVLMTSLKKQYASFVASLQQVGMAVGNSGVLSGVKIFMGGLSGVLDIVSKIPQPVISLVSAFVALRTAVMGLNKIGEVTGLTEKLWQSLNSGTKSQIEAANATRQATDAYLNQQNVIYTTASAQDKMSESYRRQLSELNEFESAVAKQNEMFANGSINADTYRANLDNLTSAYQRNVSAIAQETSGRVGEQNAIKRSEKALQDETRAETTNTTAKKTKLATLLKQKATRTAETALQKTGILLTNNETIADKASAVAKTLVGAITKSNTVAHGASAAAKTTETVATKLLTVSMTGLGVAIGAVKAVVGAFLSPIGLITAAISLFTFVSSKASQESQKLEESISELSESVTQAKERVKELKDQQARSGLSGTEEKELSFLQSKIDLEEKALKLKQQQKNNEDYFANKHVIGSLGGSDNKSENIQDAVSDFQKAQKQVEQYNARLDEAKVKAEELQSKLKNVGSLNTADVINLNKELDSTLVQQKNLAENLDKANQNMTNSASDVVTFYGELKDLLDNNQFSGAGKEQARELLATLDQVYPKVEDVVNAANDMGEAIGGVANATELLGEKGLVGFYEQIDQVREGISQMESDIEKLASESVTDEDLSRMIQEYNGFASVVGQSTADQINFIKKLKGEATQAITDTIDSQIEQYNKIKNELEKQLKSFEEQKISVDSSEVVQAKNDLESCKQKIEELKAQKDIQLDVGINSTGLSGIISELSGAVSATQGLIDAQAKLAEGTALSKSELLSLAEAYPELLTQANLFADGSVESQRSAIAEILGLKQTELNGSIDAKIQELTAEKTKLENELAINQRKSELLNDLQVDEAGNYIGTEEQLQKFLVDYANAEGELFALKEQKKADKSKESAQAQSGVAKTAAENIQNAANSAFRAYAEAAANGGRSGANSIASSAQSIITSLSSALPQINAFGETLAKAKKGETSGVSRSLWGGVVNLAGNVLSSFTDAYVNVVSKSINTKDFGKWRDLEVKKVNGEIKKNELEIRKLDTAIKNLEALKNLDFKDFASDSGGGGNKGNSAADKAAKQAARDAEKAAKEAERAAKEAAKAAEEERKAIEQITESYISNVEKLQDRIAKALKKKYEEQYNERKKLLEKEHNERVKQIQDEIDKLQGNTPQNKKDKLEGLKQKLDKWKKDDSTLGKAKQKEYMNQIKDLEKEIKIDELEAQLESENQKFDRLIDTENENCNKTLATLAQKMDDEHIYKEANDMIRNGKIQEITNLLTEYDAKWDGWGTIIGQTAGQIIAEQVKVAIANYVDVMKGSITKDGGVYTNQVTGGGSSSTKKPSSNSSSSASKPSNKPASKPKSKWKATHTIKAGDTMWDLAQKYYGDPTKWTKISNANGKPNPRTLQIGRKLYIPFRTGGYTGEQEGVAMLHKRERVLSAPQTKAFDNLVYNFMPKVKDLFDKQSNVTNSTTNNNFNKELVKIHVDKVIQNTKGDQTNATDNINRALKKSLKKSGIKLK